MAVIKTFEDVFHTFLNGILCSFVSNAPLFLSSLHNP